MPEPEDFAEAERLMRAARARAEEAAREASGERPRAAAGSGSLREMGTLLALLEGLRGTLPPELARQLADTLRELLVVVRIILDHAIEALEPPEDEPEPRVRDIPVE